MLETPLHDWHADHGARMVDFAGWHMPVQYTSINDEHQAVRTAAGLFDIAHMGRIRFTGPDAAGFLDHLVTNNVQALEPGQIRYALMCNEQGGILDDVLVYRFDDFYMLVVNASNREKILSWITPRADAFDVTVEDKTADWFMLALQGPRAIELAGQQIDSETFSLQGLKYYTGQVVDIGGEPGIASRTGYTGEDGCELIVPAESAEQLWTSLASAEDGNAVTAAGLGCRDTLRLEAAMPLYGHELSEDIDPFTAGLSFAVKLKAADFIGKAAIVEAKERSDRPVRVGLELEGRRIAREETALFQGDTQVGHVTSGTFSPTLAKSISMGYVDAACSTSGTALEAEIRGKRCPAAVVDLPFYKRG